MPRIEDIDDIGPDDAEVVDGIEQAEEEVRKFLAKVRESDEIEGEVKLTLFQYGRTRDDEDAIWEEDFVHTESDDEQAASVVDAASDDIRGLQKPRMKYVLRCEGLRYRCTFALKYESAEPEDLEDFDETPTRKGLLSQQMRHMENMTGRLNKKDALLWKMMSDQLATKDKRISELEGKEIANARAHEDLISATHLRNMELTKLQNSENRKDQALGMLIAGLPTIITKFLGSGVISPGGAAQVPEAMSSAPGGRTQLEMMVEGLLRAMSAEQFKEIQESGTLRFTMEQKLLLFHILQFIAERDERESPHGGAANGAQTNGSPAPVNSGATASGGAAQAHSP